MRSKPAKFLYQTESRKPNGVGGEKRWSEDHTTGVYANKEEAVQECLEFANAFPGWQYRVIRFDRAKVEVFK